jgi:hypothetical protein
VDCNSFGPRAIEAAVRLYGAELIVCGTDGTEFGCDWTRKALADAQIGEEAREQILHRNAAALLARFVKTAQGEEPPAPGHGPAAQRRGAHGPASGPRCASRGDPGRVCRKLPTVRSTRSTLCTRRSRVWGG